MTGNVLVAFLKPFLYREQLRFALFTVVPDVSGQSCRSAEHDVVLLVCPRLLTSAVCLYGQDESYFEQQGA